jgi:hypothetical protein
MVRIDPKKIPGARKGPVPTAISPQLATLVDKPPAGDEWLHELKFDEVKRGSGVATAKTGLRNFPTSASQLKPFLRRRQSSMARW